MNKYKLAHKYLARYFKKVVLVAIVNLIASIFDGFSIAMIIPVMQSIISSNKNFFANFPLLNRIGFLFNGKNLYETLSILIVLMFATMILKNIFVYISSIMMIKLKYTAIAEFRESLLDKILYCGNKFYDSIKSGHLVSNVYYETIRIGSFLNALLNIFVVGTKITVYIVILAIVSPKVSIVVGLAMFAVFPLIQNIMRKVKKLGDEGSTASSKFNSVLLEILSGIRVIKGFGTENHEKEKFKKADDKYINANYQYEKYNFLISPLTETIILTLFVVIFFIVLKNIKMELAALIPAVIVYIALLNRTMQQINMINIYRGQLANNLSSFDSYNEVEKNTEKFKMIYGPKTLEKFKDAIEFKNVSFGYVEGRDALKNINIKLPQGKIVAVVGTTGAGKSTLVNLIPRFYDVTKGKIFIDGIPINDLEIHNWRRKIGIVSQDVFIFNTTIKENIMYGNFKVSNLEVERAAKIANAHEFIAEMADGYNTMVGERGVRLSGGEKQRISIARAIISNPEILILDEATSAMDTKTERLIQEAIDKLTEGRTVIAIAHRLSTIQNADKIIVLEKGIVVEEGRHEELLQNSSHYKAFYDLQYGRKHC